MATSAPQARQLVPVGVHVLPGELDQQIAMLKLRTQGLSIDALTEDQIKYVTDYASGT